MSSQSNVSKKRSLSESEGSDGGGSGRKSRRSQFLKPSDRKAFFSLCSLLIDREKVKGSAAEVTLSVDNFMDFIPDDKQALVQSWKRYLKYDCDCE